MGAFIFCHFFYNCHIVYDEHVIDFIIKNMGNLVPSFTSNSKTEDTFLCIKYDFFTIINRILCKFCPNNTENRNNLTVKKARQQFFFSTIRMCKNHFLNNILTFSPSSFTSGNYHFQKIIRQLHKQIHLLPFILSVYCS